MTRRVTAAAIALLVLLSVCLLTGCSTLFTQTIKFQCDGIEDRYTYLSASDAAELLKHMDGNWRTRLPAFSMDYTLTLEDGQEIRYSSYSGTFYDVTNAKCFTVSSEIQAKVNALLQSYRSQLLESAETAS